MAELLVAEALLAAENQLAEVFALMAQAVTGRVAGAFAQLQAQVGGRLLIGQGIERHQTLHGSEEQSEDALGIQAGL
ncbi:hypothetical protein D3C86_1626880 [compost metagenome]